MQPLVEKLDSIPETVLWRRFWYELPDKHTESWYVRRALEGTWPDEPSSHGISLVCRPNLDVYRGFAGQYTRRYGNLRRDGTGRFAGHIPAQGRPTADGGAGARTARPAPLAREHTFPNCLAINLRSL